MTAARVVVAVNLVCALAIAVSAVAANSRVTVADQQLWVAAAIIALVVAIAADAGLLLAGRLAVRARRR